MIIVASYNIHACVGTDRRCDPVRIAAVIGELDADIVALQEVDAQHHDAAGALDQWQFLAQASGYHCICGISLRTHRRSYGNALLTRQKAEQVRLHDLSVATREPRGAIDADIPVDGRLLRVVATHFGLRRAERLHQAAILAQLLRARGGAAASVLLGDLNEWRPGTGRLAVLAGLFHRSPTPRSFPSRRPLLALDRVLAAGAARLSEVVVHGSALARRASDHLPVRATLSWQDG